MSQPLAPTAAQDAVLSNPGSDRVRSVRALGRRSFRQRQGLFVVEGPQAVRELLVHAPASARSLYVTADAAARHTDIADAATMAGVPSHRCTPQVLAAMTDTPHPQGMVAVATPAQADLDEAVNAVGSGFAVVLSNVRDPGNAGTVIRGADAFGAGAVFISDASVDVYNPKVVRSTAGSMFHLPIVAGHPAPDIIAACRAAGIRVLGAHGHASRPLPQIDLSVPHVWVLGNEASGLEPEVLALCDETVSVPIVRAESLNLAMAATVCLHASSAAAS